MLPGNYSYLTETYLQSKYPQHKASQNLYINGSFLPNKALLAQIDNLKKNQLLFRGDVPVACFGNFDSVKKLDMQPLLKSYSSFPVQSDGLEVKHICDIYSKNREALIEDFQLVTQGRKSAAIDDSNSWVYNPKDVFIEKGARIRSAVINAESGPVYIGSGVEIGEGSIIRGATAICEGSALNMGTRIRGESTIGPYSKVGGEISNSVVFGYSSKAHDGFLGNSVIGEWCNLGAGSSASNLKNTFKEVRLWNYAEEKFTAIGRQFCGLMMGDHSKCGINTMFNTGTVGGVGANVFGYGFPIFFIPSYSWGGAKGFVTFKLKEALEAMSLMMERRKKVLTEQDVQILDYIFEASKKYRKA
jgi:UDP-N-acetylglucosamine diphosphorylase/glucosamine-1-phosphate N-acetyltransferase